MKQMREKTNPQLEKAITELEKTKKPIWRAVAKKLKSPTRNRAAVNLSKIDRHTKENDVVIIPGKLLSDGDLKHKVAIGAFNASKKAIEKVMQQGSTYMPLLDMVEKTPKGRIMIMQ